MNNMGNNKFISSFANGIAVSEVAAARPPAALATDEVKIKLKHGQWEVEITCAEAKVRQVVETVLSSLDSARLGDPALKAQMEELRREVDALKSRPAIAAAIEARSLPAGVGGGEQKLAAAKSGTGMTCRGLIETLWLEGYFGSERSLGDVHEELSRRGYNYDRTAVSHSLTDMVRETILTRVGTMRNYRYIQKRPPGDFAAATAPAG
jgi:hypothetical protein